MLMVDDLITISNNNVEACLTIKQNCIFVSNNKFSETGLIENAAQVCSAIVGQNFFDKDDTQGKSRNLIGFISAIKSAYIYDLPSVNDKIYTKSNLISKFESDNYSICTMSCIISNKNIDIAKFTMNLFIQEV